MCTYRKCKACYERRFLPSVGRDQALINLECSMKDCGYIPLCPIDGNATDIGIGVAKLRCPSAGKHKKTDKFLQVEVCEACVFMRNKFTKAQKKIWREDFVKRGILNCCVLSADGYCIGTTMSHPVVAKTLATECQYYLEQIVCEMNDV